MSGTTFDLSSPSTDCLPSLLPPLLLLVLGRRPFSGGGYATPSAAMRLSDASLAPKVRRDGDGEAAGNDDEEVVGLW